MAPGVIFSVIYSPIFATVGMLRELCTSVVALCRPRGLPPAKYETQQ